MERTDIHITDATAGDAPLIADAILAAIGGDITSGLAGENHTEEDVRGIFLRLAERPGTQYSYRNTRIARDHRGNPAGVCVSYDGADLKPLRRAFFKEANETLGWNMTDTEIDSQPGETDPGEYYLDSLMTLPEHRGKGVGRALIADAAAKARKAGKPLGLLCDTGNTRAERLYRSSGFRYAGQRPFAGHLMNHMILD